VLLLAAALVLGVVVLQSTDRSATLTTAQTSPTPAVVPTTAPPVTAPATTLPAARDPKTVKVLSANGSSVNGLGEKVRQKLLAAGYDTLSAVTASVKVNSSQVYFATGFQPEANAVAAVLGLPATAVQALPAKAPAPGVAAANVVVVSGPDLADALSKSAPPTTAAASRTTPTTAKATPTTAKAAPATTAAPTTSTTSAPATTSTTKKP
jgi:hypothetical protein